MGEQHRYIDWARRIALDTAARKSTVDRLRRYFAGGGGSIPRYAGSRFESLGGGGDRPETANVVTAEDLIALSLLSVPVPGDAAVYLLELHRSEISDRLSQLRTDGDLVDLTPADIGPDWAARELWRVVDDAPGFGLTRTSKLMARKRPRLIPIFDAGIRAIFGSPKGQWAALNTALREDVDGERTFHELLIDLRDEAGVPRQISALRVLDVAAWMQWKEETGGVEAPNLADDEAEDEPAQTPTP